MQVAEPLQASWKAQLSLRFQEERGRTVLAERHSDGPLVVQKPLYPEGEAVCHAIVVHPPGGIAGGDELSLRVKAEAGSHALLTTPGAAKWYRSSGPWARQKLEFAVDGVLEWLPRETIVFDAALAELECEVRLGSCARYIGWDVLCLGRTGSGERYSRGKIRIANTVVKDGKLLWMERGEIDGGGTLMRSAAGLGGRSVFGTLVATDVPPRLAAECRKFAASTVLPGLFIARYLGDSTGEALECFTAVWKRIRPALTGRDGVVPRIWST